MENKDWPSRKMLSLANTDTMHFDLYLDVISMLPLRPALMPLSHCISDEGRGKDCSIASYSRSLIAKTLNRHLSSTNCAFVIVGRSLV